ncbi:hypothetical protein F5Y16DRAFT_397027 [Xylariaceae sp. FL0255]|nr:hypothetical protein F5Y16DRAFT_397027 [Xylariaceae sp. FL0255]
MYQNLSGYGFFELIVSVVTLCVINMQKLRGEGRRGTKTHSFTEIPQQHLRADHTASTTTRNVNPKTSTITIPRRFCPKMSATTSQTTGSNRPAKAPPITKFTNSGPEDPAQCHCKCKSPNFHWTRFEDMHEAPDGSDRWICAGCLDRAKYGMGCCG